LGIWRKNDVLQTVLFPFGIQFSGGSENLPVRTLEVLGSPLLDVLLRKDMWNDFEALASLMAGNWNTLLLQIELVGGWARKAEMAIAAN
jgi:hypothetical protein